RWPKKNSTHCPGWVDHYIAYLANEELCNFLVDNVVDRTLGNKYPKGSERVRNFLQAVRKKLRNFQCSSHENRQRVFGFPQ
ncbi:hypothetical protein, partial [Pseudomonas aeruginosa]|uniref:hypothetical protein n=1 Tax=Pseudomonas aeruginosa TaxID=287 RepID=UPI001C12FA69